MFSIKGTYIEGKIHLHEPLRLQGRYPIMITAVEPTYLQKVMVEGFDFEDEALAEEAFAGHRNDQRYRARGKIALVEGYKEHLYSLYDYSAGGLSFLSKEEIEPGCLLTASIKDEHQAGGSVLDFEFEVMRAIPCKGGFKIGCRFTERADEELWHSLMS